MYKRQAYIMAYFTRSAEYPHGHPFSLSISLLISWVMGMVMSVIAYHFSKVRKTMKEEMKRTA